MLACLRLFGSLGRLAGGTGLTVLLRSVILECPTESMMYPSNIAGTKAILPAPTHACTLPQLATCVECDKGKFEIKLARTFSKRGFSQPLGLHSDAAARQPRAEPGGRGKGRGPSGAEASEYPEECLPVQTARTVYRPRQVARYGGQRTRSRQ